MEALSKTYENGGKALDDVTLSIPPGMYGLRGRTARGNPRSCAFWRPCWSPYSGKAFLGEIDMLRQKIEVRTSLATLVEHITLFANSVTSAHATKRADGKYGKRLHLERVFIQQTQKTFRFTVDEKPDTAAIDPLALTIDKTPGNNQRTVEKRKMKHLSRSTLRRPRAT